MLPAGVRLAQTEVTPGTQLPPALCWPCVAAAAAAAQLQELLHCIHHHRRPAPAGGGAGRGQSRCGPPHCSGRTLRMHRSVAAWASAGHVWQGSYPATPDAGQPVLVLILGAACSDFGACPVPLPLRRRLIAPPPQQRRQRRPHVHATRRFAAAGAGRRGGRRTMGLPAVHSNCTAQAAPPAPSHQRRPGAAAGRSPAHRAMASISRSAPSSSPSCASMRAAFDCANTWPSSLGVVLRPRRKPTAAPKPPALARKLSRACCHSPAGAAARGGERR